MWLHNPKKLREILFRLVECPSISGTAKELDMAETVHSMLSEIPYFKRYPECLQLREIEGDKLNRCFVAALLKGKGNNTVVLLHHHDVVDVDDYGSFKMDAFYPDRITKKLRSLMLPEDARRDMESGEWIFGRGVMDMKAGAVLQIALIHDYSQVSNLEGNILLLSVPGEESNSEGMLAAVPYLNELREQYGLDYVAVINSEPHSIDEKGLHDITIGSIGKLLPVFYCFGKETHASRPFEGLNSSLLFSLVETLMENNLELCDQAEGEFSPPPVNLKNRDLKTHYNVTTPQVTTGYFNVFTMQRSIDEILSILKDIAYRAFGMALEMQRGRAERYAELTGEKTALPPWKPNVYTFEELYQSAYKARGESFRKDIETYIESLKVEEKEEREFTIKLINRVHDYCPDRNPKIVIGFAPPYYPHIINTGKTDKERYLLKVVDKLRNYGKKQYNIEFKLTRVFKGITDLSYCGLQDSENVLKHLKPNMPALGHVYTLPIEELKKLDVAVINVGPFGRDSHRFTERLHLPYFEKVAPSLLKHAVDEFFNFKLKEV